MNYQIENWFPKPIYYTDQVCVPELEVYEKRIKEILEEKGWADSEYLGVQSTHMTYARLHEDPVFRNFCDAVLHHSFNFAVALGYKPEVAFKLKIENMWANVSDQHGYNFPHTHPGALISGAFYIKSVPENVLTFYDKYDVLEMPTEESIYRGQPVEYKCDPARLILFKADFVHGNAPQKSVGEKIVISFNLRT